jgi:leader peptidase (prepilin peptidase) / N-methyltransferase
MIRIVGTIFAGLLGLAFGSFLNVCLSRWPADESIVHPRSHCMTCGRTLKWWENVPLVSWLVLRGRCRTCKSKISWRYPLVELAVGALWANVGWHHTNGLFIHFRLPSLFIYYTLCRLVSEMAFSWLLIALATLDAENLWLPNSITIPGIILGLILDAAEAIVMVISPWYGSVHPSLFPIVLREVGPELALRLLGILAAAGLVLLIRWIYWLIRRREGVGLGDAKLMAMLAAWLGLPGALLSFGLGVVLGAIAALVLLALPSTRKSSKPWANIKLPLGTFLCVGGIVSSLWGERMIGAYLRWAGF